jgi:hypothetical protein
LLILAPAGCRQAGARATREPLPWSGWFEERAIARGHIEPGDIAQFGCPRGWMSVDDTSVALRAGRESVTYRGTDPQPRDGTHTCIAQQAFELPPAHPPRSSAPDGVHQPVTPVSVAVGPDRTTIVFSSELPLAAAVYIGQDTPCGPRVIGVRLGDLLKWLSDPQSATKRDFLGMISAGCPERIER